MGAMMPPGTQTRDDPAHETWKSGCVVSLTSEEFPLSLEKASLRAI
jgi:hypothetical protein